MPLSMYQVSVPVFIRGMEVLGALLAKGAAHAAAAGLDPQTLAEARLAPDMLPLTGQVQRASDSSKLAAQRLTGLPAPRFEDDETTLDQLRERVARTIAYLRTVEPAQLEGSDSREVVLTIGKSSTTFKGIDYLLTFAVPNFFFHVTTAYDILRHQGVPVGKRDYLDPTA